MSKLYYISPAGRYWLIALMLLGLLIRLGAAYIQPNYLDEGFNYYLCQAGLAPMIEHLKSDVHTPAIQLLCYPIARITDDIFWMRLPSVLFGVLAIGSSFWLARHFFSENTSLWLTAFISCDYKLWSTDALMRPYGPLTFCLIAMWLGMLDIHAGNAPYSDAPAPRYKRWRWFLFACACLGASSFHMLGLLSTAVCLLLSFRIAPPARRTTLTILLLSMVPSLLWFLIGPLSHHTADSHIKTASALDRIADLARFPINISELDTFDAFYASRSELWAEMIRSIRPWLGYGLNIAFFVLYIYGYRRLAASQRWKANLVALSWIFPFIALGLASLLQFMDVFQARYSLPFTIVFFIVLYAALSERAQKIASYFFLTISAIICLAFPFQNALWVQYWQGAIDFIDARQRPGDLITINVGYAAYSFSMAYNRENISFNFDDSVVKSFQNPTPGKLLVFPIHAQNCAPQLLGALGPGRVFLILCQEDMAVPAWFNQYYEVVDALEYYNLHDWAKLRVFELQHRSPTEQR